MRASNPQEGHHQELCCQYKAWPGRRSHAENGGPWKNQRPCWSPTCRLTLGTSLKNLELCTSPSSTASIICLPAWSISPVSPFLSCLSLCPSCLDQQAHAITPGSSMWVQAIKLSSSCLYVKHFADWATSPALILLPYPGDWARPWVPPPFVIRVCSCR